MKLLGWVHRKLRHSTSEFAIGGGQQQQSYGSSRPIRQSGYIDDKFRKSFGGLSRSVEDGEEENDDDEEEEEEVGRSISDMFHGFLAIGTLGDPSTPTFRFSVEEITEKQLETEVTENELKLINDELERVLGGGDHQLDTFINDSSSSRRNSHVSTARNSHVSSTTTGRSSHVSTGSNITVFKPSSDVIDGNTTICPLQGYLLGSGVNNNNNTSSNVKMKEYRTSLGELFQKTTKDETSKRSDQKESPAVNLVKKLLKKKILHTSKPNYAASDSADSTKLRKMMHMFHKKVHPESSKKAGVKNHHEYSKNNISSYEYHDDGDEDIILIPQRSFVSKRRYKNHFTTTTTTCESESKEHWIKTDADYLVLEL